MKENYYNTITMVERMHRLFLDVLKNDLNRLNIRDINNIQALIIYNIGHKKLSVGDLTDRGYYQGSNVSYNLRKMVEHGYILQCPCAVDRRMSDIELTQKGLKMHDVIDEIFGEHSKRLTHNKIDDDKLVNINNTLNSIERYLINV